MDLHRAAPIFLFLALPLVLSHPPPPAECPYNKPLDMGGLVQAQSQAMLVIGLRESISRSSGGLHMEGFYLNTENALGQENLQPLESL